MNKIVEPRTLPGFRDFLPEDMVVRQRVIDILKTVFAKYGFSPMETPALEYQDILLGKYGPEAEQLMYLFDDRGERKVGMKYDLTLPSARVVSQYQSLARPFKRYQIQQVWRADRPQKGRYREITQCDVDTFGASSPLADAEIIAVIYECLTNLGFKDFLTKINSRQILFAIMEKAGVNKDKYLSAIQSIDKLDKKPEVAVKSELDIKGFKKAEVDNIFFELKNAEPDKNLEEMFSFIIKLGVPKNYFRFEPFLSRGLDYYTGPVFETVVVEPKIGSVTGGGRYDGLIGQFTGIEVPATGTSFGLDRICDVITELKLWPNLPRTSTKVLVTIFSFDTLAQSLDTVKMLRTNGVNAEVFLDQNSKLDKQLKYADAKGIPFALIIGPDEVKKDLLTIKNLRTKTQTTTTASDALKLIREEN